MSNALISNICHLEFGFDLAFDIWILALLNSFRQFKCFQFASDDWVPGRVKTFWLRGKLGLFRDALFNGYFIIFFRNGKVIGKTRRKIFRKHFFPEFVSIIMLHQSQIRIRACQKFIKFVLCQIISFFSNKIIPIPNFFVKISFGPVLNIDAVRFYHGSQKFHASGKMLKIYFIGMELKKKICH